MLKSFCILAATVLAAVVTQAGPMPDAPEFEVMCRLKAKDIAAETYRGCVTEARTSQIEDLKKDYQDRLKTMKEDYQNKLKQLSGAKASPSSAMAPALTPAPTGNGKKTAKRSSKLPPKRAPMNPGGPLMTPVTSSSATNAASGNMEEMTVRLRSPAPSPNADESTLDVPEPTPVEDVPTADNRY